MKTHLLFIFFLLACSSTPTTLSLPPKEHMPESLQVIRNLYASYFANIGKLDVPYSKSFLALLEKNKSICKQHAGTDICGWGADGDVLLDSQEYAAQLTLESSKFTATALAEDRVKVSFNVYPQMQDRYYDKELIFHLKKEQGIWVIDDIYYQSGVGAREVIINENESFLPK